MADVRSARLSPLSWSMVVQGMKTQSGFKRRMSPNCEAPVPPDSRGYAPPVPSRDLRCPSIHLKNVMYRALGAPRLPLPGARLSLIAKRTLDLPANLETKFSPRGLTSIITRNTSSANIRPNFIDKACRAYAYFTRQRGTSRAFAAHPALISCHIVAGDQIQIVIGFRGEPGPLG